MQPERACGPERSHRRSEGLRGGLDLISKAGLRMTEKVAQGGSNRTAFKRENSKCEIQATK